MTNDIEPKGDLTTDVAVVGGGLAGLAAAIAAARAGTRVVLVEAHQPGGRGRSAERDGYVLDQGPHALYLGGAAASALAELGAITTGGTPPLDAYRTWWDGRLEPLPLSPSALLTTRLLGARSKVTAARLLGAIRSAARKAADVSFGEWMHDHGVRPDLERLLCTVARLTTYIARPELAPAPAVLRQLAVANGGVRYVDGGWQAIVDQLVDLARRAGVIVITRSPVTTVVADGRGHDGWLLQSGDREVSATSVVIATGGPAQAERLVDRRPGWVETAGPPVRAACLHIGTLEPAAVRHLFSADDPLYLSRHSPAGRMAPDGHDLYGVMRYVAADEHLDAATARAELERHASRAGLPPSDGRMIERFLADMTVTWGSPTVGVQRPRGDELAAEGIHVAGDWVGGHLLADASLDSGLRAGRAAARRRVAVA